VRGGCSIYRTRGTTHHGVLREDIDGEREELQKELDLVRKHSSISLKRFGEIESVFKRGAFALVDTSERRAGKPEARCKHKLSLDLPHKRSEQQLVQ
jgi:hypothetical protein